MPTVNLVTTALGKKAQGAWPLDKAERHARQARRRPKRGVYAPPVKRPTLYNLVQSAFLMAGRRFGKTAAVKRSVMDYEGTRNRMRPAAHLAVAKFFRGPPLR